MLHIVSVPMTLLQYVLFALQLWSFNPEEKIEGLFSRQNVCLESRWDSPGEPGKSFDMWRQLTLEKKFNPEQSRSFSQISPRTRIWFLDHTFLMTPILKPFHPKINWHVVPYKSWERAVMVPVGNQNNLISGNFQLESFETADIFQKKIRRKNETRCFHLIGRNCHPWKFALISPRPLSQLKQIHFDFWI